MRRILLFFKSEYAYDKGELTFFLLMWYRIVYGVIRVVLGTTFLWFIGSPFAQVFQSILRYELIEDPNDILIRAVSSLSAHPELVVTYFLALYLIFWGTVDIFLSASLLRKKTWAFPITIWIIIIFMGYEIYRVTNTHSLMLATFIGIDTLVVYFIYREYKRHIKPQKDADFKTSEHISEKSTEAQDTLEKIV